MHKQGSCFDAVIFPLQTILLLETKQPTSSAKVLLGGWEGGGARGSWPSMSQYDTTCQLSCDQAHSEGLLDSCTGPPGLDRGLSATSAALASLAYFSSLSHSHAHVILAKALTEHVATSCQREVVTPQQRRRRKIVVPQPSPPCHTHTHMLYWLKPHPERVAICS